MHSPPPTPNSRANGRATRRRDVFQEGADASASSSELQAVSRKRTLEQAGLITPQETPRKRDLNKDGRLNGTLAAKILFPSVKRKGFKVFQDPKSPDPFHDDHKNPFRAPSPRASRQRESKTPERIDSTLITTPDRDTASLLDLPDRVETSRRRTRSMKRTPSPRRSDGMTYVFRGKRVFRKYHSAREAEEAEAVKPKRLFVKEMSAPKLSNPFDDEASDDSGFDGLELSTYQEIPPSRSSTGSIASGTARQLF